MSKPVTFLFLGLFFLLVVAFFSRGVAVADTPLRINEIRLDQPESDIDEYFELFGDAEATLDNLTYIVIGDGGGTSGSGVIENVTALTGQSLDSAGFFVAAEDTFSLGTADMVTTLNFENSDNVTHLLVTGFSGSSGQDLDTDDDGVLDAEPWTSVVDKIGIIKEENPPSGTEWHYGPPTVGPDGSYAPGHVYYCPEGLGWQIGAFDPDGGDDTPGAANSCVVPPDPGLCGEAATKIHEIQGDGDASPLVGQTVTVEALVHGDFQSSDQLGGFLVQEEEADADTDPMTSEGLYIADSGFGIDVQPGDIVRVQGAVQEFYDRTELSNITSVTVCSSIGDGEVLVIPLCAITLPVASLDVWEYCEGMAVGIFQKMVLTDNYNLGRYGELSMSAEGRLFTPTNIVPPGDAANAQQEENDLSRILLDDGSNVQNPEPPPYFMPDGTLRLGYTVDLLSGALDYAFGSYRLQGAAIPLISDNGRPAPPDMGDLLTVAGFNVLNYFTTLADEGPVCGPSGDMDCRGADDAAEFERQRTKIIAALSQMDADVVGLLEIENNNKEAVEDLVGGLNEALGADTYAYIDTGTIGTDAIKVALIYKPAAVQPIGDYAVLDSSVDPNFIDTKNRPVLAQSFQEQGTGEIFTVAVNHLKSKGSACDDVGDPDTGDGQGNCNQTRVKAAAAEAAWLAGDPTGVGGPDVLIIGDMNSYALEDPITTLKATGYTDLVARYAGPHPYSYVFFGQAGYLDHSLASSSLLSKVRKTAVWHINADEPSALDYNDYNQESLYQPDAYRASDHDPVIIGLDLGQYQVYMPVIGALQQGEVLDVSGHVRLDSVEGPGLTGALIYMAVAVYPGQVVAVTDADGFYRAPLLDTQGHQETIRLWVEAEGYTFQPPEYDWIYYGLGSVVTHDFVATEESREE